MIWRDKGEVRLVVVDEAKGLDPITLILSDENGKGKVIAECYGESWSTYFGGIGSGKTLVKFLSGLNCDYLGNRLISNTFHSPTKRETVYVNRISQAIIDACKIKEGIS